jgi:hypothetical protein
MAAPPPVAGLVAQPRLDGVERDVARDRQQLGIAPHDHRGVPPLKDVADVPVPPVERLGVQPVQPVHAHREIWLGRLDEQVHVVAHQAVRKAPPALPLDDLSQQPEVRVPIDVIDVDRLLPDTARKDVHEGAGELFTRLPSHTPYSRLRPNLAPKGAWPPYPSNRVRGPGPLTSPGA